MTGAEERSFSVSAVGINVAVIRVCLALLNILGEQQTQVHNYFINWRWPCIIERNFEHEF